jgi:predicted aldo/keto reductase-like oxidoreductase
MAEPGRETSWHVLAAAARLTRTPLWHLEPAQRAGGEVVKWWGGEVVVTPSPPHHVAPSQVPHARLLGPERLAVAPLGISGHYGLPIEGFVRALESGVNLLFWEPSYRSLTEFVARLSAADRRAIHLVAGTFEAEGERVRRDAERALRLLKVERLAVFLLFWVRSWDRIAVDVYRELERLKEEGKVGVFGLSTHVRELAVEAMEAGWDPVMVRHSAAHRGAEEHVFPKAVEWGTSLITFNNTCYGRLLQSCGPAPAPTAADCYRYALAQPGVRCCLSAPATLEQLEENLKALQQPELPEERLRFLQAHGAARYAEETTFRRLVRSL